MNGRNILTAMLLMVIALSPAMTNGTGRPQAAARNPDVDGSADERRALVAHNLRLTASEATGFWPVYSRFERDLAVWRERRQRIVAEFGENYDSMSDEVAQKLTVDRLDLDEARCRLMRSYLPQFSKVLPARKVARYYDIEAKIRAVVNAEIAESIPLTE
jgi:hypothetical protein